MFCILGGRPRLNLATAYLGLQLYGLTLIGLTFYSRFDTCQYS